MRSIILGLLAALLLPGLEGCGGKKREYGVETTLHLPGRVRQTWAVAPAVDLSGQRAVDPILQGDLLFAQVKKVAGVTPLPVNSVVQVYAALRIERVQSEQQAALVCDLLGCDALLVPTVTAYDPYDPPKFGVALHLFRRGGYERPANVDPRELARLAAPRPGQAPPERPAFVQVVGMFDAADGSVRIQLADYARGRFEPYSPYEQRLYMVEMDRYCGFVYHSLIRELLGKPGIGVE